MKIKEILDEIRLFYMTGRFGNYDIRREVCQDMVSFFIHRKGDTNPYYGGSYSGEIIICYEYNNTTKKYQLIFRDDNIDPLPCMRELRDTILERRQSHVQAQKDRDAQNTEFAKFLDIDIE